MKRKQDIYFRFKLLQIPFLLSKRTMDVRITLLNLSALFTLMRRRRRRLIYGTNTNAISIQVEKRYLRINSYN
jgi:hypothetical protein